MILKRSETPFLEAELWGRFDCDLDLGGYDAHTLEFDTEAWSYLACDLRTGTTFTEPCPFTSDHDRRIIGEIIGDVRAYEDRNAFNALLGDLEIDL